MTAKIIICFFSALVITLVILGDKFKKWHDNDWNTKELNLKDFIIIICVLCLIIFFPWIIYDYLKPNYSKPTEAGQIGDLFGGLWNPIIALLSAALVYVAFIEQVKANKLLSVQNERQSFESKFFDLIKMHRENIESFNIDGIKGRHVIRLMIAEFESIYNIVSPNIPGQNKNLKDIKRLRIKISYEFFFFGVDMYESQIRQTILETYSGQIMEKTLDKIHQELKKFKEEETRNIEYYFRSTKGLINEIEDLQQKSKSKYSYPEIFNLLGTPANKLENYTPLIGQQTLLGHYYRHLFNTFAYLHNQKVNIIREHEKKIYGNMLRAQLSNPEIMLFFYNVVSRLGNRWHNFNSSNNENYNTPNVVNLVEIYDLFKSIEIKKLIDDINPKEFFKCNYDFEGKNFDRYENMNNPDNPEYTVNNKNENIIEYSFDVRP